jgi:tetratricopeptide (TPR) repeat protein
MRIPRRLLFPILALSLLAAPPLARGQTRWDRGVRTGDAHMVVVTPPPSLGLEEGIPRNSWYAKGIALDVEGRWEASFEAYRKARDEFEQLLGKHPRQASMVRGWKLKAEWQMQESRALRPIRHYFGASGPFGISQSQVAAKHNKWLAIRAFLGQAPAKLRDEIIDGYQAVTRHYSYNHAKFVLGLAAFYHELGRHKEGRETYATIRRTRSIRYTKDEAYYHAAAGNRKRAFELLERAVRRSSSDRRYVLMSNDFDRLRGDPRFSKLVGEP